MKEVVTQGYLIQKQDEQDDYLFFIYSGRCRILYSTAKDATLFPPDIANDRNKKHLVIGTLRRGEHFGEGSALNDLPNPYTIEAVSPKVELYKIHRSYFTQYFGGLNGEPVS